MKVVQLTDRQLKIAVYHFGNAAMREACAERGYSATNYKRDDDLALAITVEAQTRGLGRSGWRPR